MNETSHFWAGDFVSLESYTELFAETYSDDDDAPISPFAKTQDEIYYDHDSMEYGYSSDAASLAELVAGYSYADQWSEEFSKLVESLGLTDVNAFLFMSESEIESPKSFQTESGRLTYLGKISYEI